MNLIPRNSLFDLDRFFDNPWMGLRGETSESGTFSPRVDVREGEKEYEITAELPGVKKEDISVTLENGVLSIQAETRHESKEEKEGRLIRQERRYGKFVRSFDLGPQVHEGDITASFDNGVLKLTAPKTEQEVSSARRINIQ